MHLYHYSKEIRMDILSKRQQESRQPMPAWSGDRPPYEDHISFFFDPIPAKLLPTLYGSDHPAWSKGTVLYEHKVNVDQFNADVFYDVVESRKQTKFYDDFVKKHNWVEDDPAILALWKKEIEINVIKWGEKGRSLKNLKKQILLNVGGTTQAYLDAFKRDDFNYNRMKYASCVPHLMLYPEEGKAKPMAINKLVMGSDLRTPISTPAAVLSWR